MRGRRRSAWAFAALPLVSACAVVGYPAPRTTPTPIQASSPSTDAAVASTDTEPVIVRPAPAPVGIAAPEKSARAPREYEVFGQRYTIMADAGDYTEVGVASWYGNELAGRPTSSGEIYDPQRLTAAHRTLPMSTWVEVKNLQNGRSVVVRVNDRGPFSQTHERIIDVSYAAARVLGLIGPGIARVEVRVVPAPTPRF